MKKTIAICLACAMLLLSACGGTSSAPPQAPLPQALPTGLELDDIVGITGAEYISTMKLNGYTVDGVAKDEVFTPYTDYYTIDKSFNAFNSDYNSASYYFNYKNRKLAMDAYAKAEQSDMMENGVRMDWIETDDYVIYTCMYDTEGFCFISLLTGNSIILVFGSVNNAERFAETMEFFGVPETPLIGDDSSTDNSFKDINEPNVIEYGDPDWISPDFDKKGNLADFFGTNDEDEILSYGSLPIISTLVFQQMGETGGFKGYPTPEIAWGCISSMGTFFNLESGEILDADEKDQSFTISADTVKDLMYTFFGISPDNLPSTGTSEVIYLEGMDAYAMFWHYSGGAYGVSITNYRVEGDRCTMTVQIYADGGDDTVTDDYLLVLEKNPASRVGYSIMQFQCPE